MQWRAVRGKECDLVSGIDIGVWIKTVPDESVASVGIAQNDRHGAVVRTS